MFPLLPPWTPTCKFLSRLIIVLQACPEEISGRQDWRAPRPRPALDRQRHGSGVGV